MPILKNPSERHPVYQQYVKAWEMIRDCVRNRVRDAGTKYLPQLSGSEPGEYEDYKLRALWLSATGRTLQGFVGMAFRKPPVVAAAKSLLEEGFLAHCTVKRKGIEALARMTTRELLQMGRVALLADMPREADSSIDPWIAVYSAESLINWEYGTDAKGEPVLVEAVLFENVEERHPTEPDKIVLVEQWRVLMLLNPGSTTGSQYAVEIWRRSATAANEFVKKEEIIPAIRGRAFTRIPIEIIDLTNDDGDLTPPLEAIAEVNVSHFRSSADLEHGRHFTALPTPWVTGITKNDGKLKIGSRTAWLISDAAARVGMLEFTGQGLGSLEKALVEKENLMAVLGARMLEAQKKGVEAADTHQIRTSGEQSVLASTVRAAQQGINAILTLLGPYVAGLQKAVVELNTDFTALALTSQELTSLVSALQSGAISEETFFYNLQQAEMYPPGRTFEEEAQSRDKDEQKSVEQEVKRIKALPPTDLGPV
jgi:hypothetical protein